MVTRLALMMVALCAGVSGVSGMDAIDTRHYSARAFDLDSGELLYTEQHIDSLRSGQISASRVLYHGSTGDTLATKHLQFEAGETRPAFVMVYHEDGALEGVSPRADSLVLMRRQDRSSETESRTVAMNEPVVIDGGFDHAVRRHWDRLAEGGRFDFDFPVPNRLASYRFRIRMTGETVIAGQAAYRFRIEPANFFVRLIAPSIELTYDRSSRRLVRYEGISDVVDGATGKRYRARIEFDYPDAAEPLVLNGMTASSDSF